MAAVFGGPLATYTGVLLANIAVPSWHELHTKLPFVFDGSAMAAGGGICLAFTPAGESEPVRMRAIIRTGIELAALRTVEDSASILAEPSH
ncbi:hypothetical protein JKP76_03595 [Blastococcus sp. TML/C7B]|uniref:hypothetical protein n=1 Tax=Blastococcus sp. TML/C7B TaxID=2798728 RepID=UPI00190AAE34|nr:hypothetical protein [Blastococcus sp. TML/C7B]MBN1095201.1 hypothetical protein [Blastococcus sp. TML/C7B]